MKSKGVLLFFATVLALLGLVCLLMPREGAQLGNLTLHTPSLSEILDNDTEDSESAAVDSALAALQQRHRDSLESHQQWNDSSRFRFWMPNNDETFFDPLFAAMETASQRGRWLRVMHYGDSQLEMDHVTSQLRLRLQELFGGSGPGLVSLQTVVPSPTVSQWSSQPLTRLAPFGDSLSVHSRGNYGPMIQCFRLGGSSTTTLKLGANKHCDPRVAQCTHVGVIYRPLGSHLNASLSIRAPYRQEATAPDTTLLSADGQVGMMVWDADSALSKLSLSLNGSADIYGVRLDGAPGIMVDNIPLRGCSGYEFTKVDATLLADAYSMLDIGLIIMQFGGNAIPYLRNENKRTNYCKNIGIQIDRLHRCCPKATILFVGPADMATTLNGTLQSYPQIEPLISELRDSVNAHGAAYWSQYHAMGGRNAIIQWTRRGLAGHDYIHFSQKGADTMGDMLAEALKNLYQYYLLRKNRPPIES